MIIQGVFFIDNKSDFYFNKTVENKKSAYYNSFTDMLDVFENRIT